jgi:hypothetical protein
MRRLKKPGTFLMIGQNVSHYELSRDWEALAWV